VNVRFDRRNSEAIITDALLASPDWAPRMSFLARRITDGAAIGSKTLYDLSMAYRCVENGETWLSRPCWRQGFNEDMKYDEEWPGVA
jgi:hypothetical protein